MKFYLSSSKSRSEEKALRILAGVVFAIVVTVAIAIIVLQEMPPLFDWIYDVKK